MDVRTRKMARCLCESFFNAVFESAREVTQPRKGGASTVVPRLRTLALMAVLVVVFTSALALGAETSGGTIFKSKCVLCHGADGTGNTPLGKQLQAADLHSKDVQKKSDAELHKVVHDGNGNMPPFGEQLSDDEIDQVIQYVRTFGKTAKK